MIAFVLCWLLFARVWCATPASECELSEEAEAEAATVSHLQVKIGIAPEAPHTVANSSMLAIDGEQTVGSNFSDAKIEIENIYEDTDIEDNETLGLAQTVLGQVEDVHDDECAFWSKDGEKGHLNVVRAGAARHVCFQALSGEDGNGGCECAVYTYWTACNSVCPLQPIAGTASVCKKGIRAFHCGANAKAKICETSTLQTNAPGSSAARNGFSKSWANTDCRDFDYGEDKEGLEGNYKYYHVTVRSGAGTRRRRGEGGEEHRRRRRRRGWR